MKFKSDYRERLKELKEIVGAYCSRAKVWPAEGGWVIRLYHAGMIKSLLMELASAGFWWEYLEIRVREIRDRKGEGSQDAG